MTAVTSAPASGAFAACLTAIRRSRKPYLSQSRLANTAGCDHAAISRLESGSRNPSRAMVLSLATALDATPDEMARLLGAAGFSCDLPIADPLVAELDAMLRDETLPELARHYLRTAVDTAMLLARMKTAQLAGDA